MLNRWKILAEKLALETAALALAAIDPRTPWYAKAWSALVAAYALSPIDLIPDFIPVLGYLDDLLIVPLGIWLAMKMIPAPVMADAHQKALQGLAADGRLKRLGIAIIVVIWLVVLAGMVLLAMKIL
jgi:uncharacterized membrane protein YkvA (DUF1232 family)